MSEQDNVVNPEVTTPQAEEATTPVAVSEATATPAPGSKTPPDILLKSLQEEREKRRVMEEKLAELESKVTASAPSGDYYSDEGKALKQELDEVRSALKGLTEDREYERLYTQYPELKDKDGEFKTFAADYPRHKLENVAKLFLAENGMFEPQRKGLEATTGGTRTPSTGGMTNEEVKNLRETNYRKYEEMVLNGQLKISK